MRDRTVQNEPQTEAQVRFAAVRRLLFANFEAMVQDATWSAWHLGQIAGNTDAPEGLRAVAEFALRYQANGIEEAIALVPKSAVPTGVPVNVSIPHAASERVRPGILVGLTDAKYVDGRRVIEGVAAIKNGKDNWAFVNVAIQTGGETILLSEDQQLNNPNTRILLRSLI